MEKNPNYPATTGNPSGKNRGNTPKRHQEYCMVVCSYTKKDLVDLAVQVTSLSGMTLKAESSKKSCVVFYGIKNGTFNFLNKDNADKSGFVEGCVRYFSTAIEAVNWLSKNEGWSLVSHISTSADELFVERWIMKRDVK